jgi:hypothetical protein
MLKFFLSRLESEAVVENLLEMVDQEEVDPESSTLYAGGKAFVGRVSPDRFKVGRRPAAFWPLWWLTPGYCFKPVVNGTITRNERGTRIEIVGGTPIWIKISWVLALLGAATLIGLVTVFAYPFNITHDPERSGANLLLGIIVLNVVGGIFVVLPLIGWFLTRNDLRIILNELQNRLDLVPVFAGNSEKDQDSNDQIAEGKPAT